MGRLLGGRERHVGFSDIYLVATTGGSPRKLLFSPPLDTANYPVWSSDGRTLLFVGSGAQGLDRWTASVDTGKADKTGVFDAFRRQQLPISIPGDWQQDQILFSARTGDSTALWQIPLSPRSWRAGGAARQLTLGTGLDVIPSAAAGALVFASLAENIDIWSLPADTNQGKPLAGPNRLTQDAARDIYPAISLDGRRMVFVSTRSGNSDIWMKDLETGRETQLTVDPKTQFSFIAADHTRIAYQSAANAGPVQYLLSAGPRGYDRAGEKICEDCGILSDVSSDGSRTLHFEYDPSRRRGRIISLDVRSSEKHLLIDDGSFLVGPRFSSDGSWIAFHEIIDLPRPRRQIFIAPVRSGGPVPRSEWTPITDGSAMDRFPAFSPDGNLLYFISERDGFRCIVAQRLDMATKRPSGRRSTCRTFTARSAR